MSGPEFFKVRQAQGFRGEIRVPGDKSITHRAIIMAALAAGKSEIRGFLKGEDCKRTLATFQAMGIEAKGWEGEVLTIHGKGLAGLKEPADVLDAGNSGTTLRLLSGVLAAQPFFSVITGDDSLRRRPMKRVVEPLRSMGARIEGRGEGNYAPLAIQGGKLQGIYYQSPVASAQIKSCLLLAGLWAQGETAVNEPSLSRDHTERIFSYFNIPYERKDLAVHLRACEGFSPRPIRVPGDISSAAFFLVGALLLPDSRLLLRDVGINPTRTGILDALREMGARITVKRERLFGEEPAADLLVESSQLRGIKIGGSLIPRMIDEIPIFALAAAQAFGKTEISDAKELRVKESDRLAAIAAELVKLGVKIEEKEDGLVIHGGGALKGAKADSWGDHRLAMMLTMAGFLAKGETKIQNVTCIDTSFPQFPLLCKRLAQASFESGQDKTKSISKKKPVKNKLIIAIDGPVGSGKSTIAKLLAQELKYTYIDSGAMYRALGLKATEKEISWDEGEKLARLARRIKIEFKNKNGRQEIWMDGKNVTAKIRTPLIGQAASAVSVHKGVRERMVALQQAMGKAGGVVMDGRDIGTVVFPRAEAKFYLDASLAERARRRLLDFKAQGLKISRSQMEKEIRERDRRDTNRKHSPLKKATDAVYIDTSKKSISQVLKKIKAALPL